MKICSVFLVFLCLLISLSASAQMRLPTAQQNDQEVSLKSFGGRKLSMTDETFRRFVIRQLKSMHVEFFFVIKKLHPDSAELISLRERLMYMQKDFLRWRNDCQSKNINCLPQLRELYRQCKNLDQTILHLQESKLMLSDVKDASDIDIRLQIYSSLTEMVKTNSEILHSLELTMMVSETPYFSLMPPQQDFSHLIHRMLLMAELNMTALLGSPLREEFYSLWTNFIKPIEFHILENEDKNYYLNRIEELNIYWNNFHKNLSKTHQNELTSPILSTVRVMHNRWNSLLRLILR